MLSQRFLRFVFLSFVLCFYQIQSKGFDVENVKMLHQIVKDILMDNDFMKNATVIMQLNTKVESV